MLCEKSKMKLIDLYPDWMTNGIFKQLEAYNVPWKDYIDGTTLDLDYFGNRSGSKIISSLLEKMNVDGVLDADKQNKIAELCYKKYGYSWEKVWTAVISEYNPIENYKMERTETGTEKITDNETQNGSNTTNENGSDTSTNSGSIKNVQGGSNTEEGTASTTTDTSNDVYGYDSTNGVPETKSHTAQNGNNSNTINFGATEESTDTRSNTLTKTNESEVKSNNTRNGTQDKNNSLTITQSGNIGVTTSQQMVESEIKLRFDYKIFDLIFQDVDKILTLNIFY